VGDSATKRRVHQVLSRELERSLGRDRSIEITLVNREKEEGGWRSNGNGSIGANSPAPEGPSHEEIWRSAYPKHVERRSHMGRIWMIGCKRNWSEGKVWDGLVELDYHMSIDA